MPNPIGPELVYELTTVADPTMSPDGTRVAFTRSKIDKESMTNRSQIMANHLRKIVGYDHVADNSNGQQHQQSVQRAERLARASYQLADVSQTA